MEDSVKNPYMQGFIMKNPIFHTQDLCLCTPDTNLICEIYYISHYAQKTCAEMRLSVNNLYIGFFALGICVCAHLTQIKINIKKGKRYEKNRKSSR